MTARTRPRPSAGRAAGRAAQGFILLATLGLLVVLTLLASAIALSVERARDDQAAADRAFQDALDRQATEATVLYLLATQRMTFAGLTIDTPVRDDEADRAAMESAEETLSYRPVGNELRLDGTVYQGFGRVRFSLQDNRGRFSINFGSRRQLDRWLELRKVPAGRRADLMARLLDYQDADALTRLNGAEADDYERAGRPPLRNLALATPLELRKVLGWEQPLATLSDAELLDRFSTSRSALVNVNSAGMDVLATVPGWDRRAASQLLAERAKGAFVDTASVIRAAGVLPVEEDMLILYPGESGSLSLWTPDEGPLTHQHWRLTPVDDAGRPWRTQYRLFLPRPDADHAAPARSPEAKIFADADPENP